MSSEALSLTSATHSTLSQQTFMVGNPRIAKQFFELILRNGSTALVETDPLAKRDIDFVFGRDSRVIGLNNTHLLPYPIKDPLLEGHFKALLPSSANSFVTNTIRTGFGEGFADENAKDALSYVKKHNLPHRQMLSSIEGGNSYVFFDSHDRPKAIVGIHSLVLTMIGLEEQGYFVRNQDALQKLSVSAPSDDAVRRARNMSLYAAKRDFDSRLAAFSQQRQKMSFIESGKLHASLMEELKKTWGSETNYRQLLIAPIGEEDKVQYFNQACVWEAKVILACQAIADDLQVPVENIAFVPQTHFHIDMEMFVAPNGDDVYVDNALSQISVTHHLERIGCNVISLPGVHKVSHESINFMNGVFVSTSSGPLFVTNGVRSKHFQLLHIFQKTLLNTKPSFRVAFLDEMMPEILTNKDGGIHCLTWEKPNCSTPSDIIHTT